MKSDVEYAKYGGPPWDWKRLAVFDAATGQKLKGVVEANAAEGWFIRYARDADGRILRDGDQKVTERVEAEILIQRTYGCGAPIRPPEGWTPSQRYAVPEETVMARAPLRFTPPDDGAGRKPPPIPSPAPPPPSGSHKPRTPEDGLRIHTPEDGQPVTTRED